MPHYVYVPLVLERKFLIFRLDSETGKLSLSDQVELSAQPYQLCMDPQRRYLYQQLRDEGYSGVASFRIDPASGGATQIGEVELEADACYVATDHTGRFLLAAYLIPGMVTVHPIGDDGAAHGPPTDRRETEIYAHSIQTDPSNRFAFVPHVKPTDSIHQFRFDPNRGRLTPSTVARIETEPGYGPRHYVFHPTLDVVYFNAEQASAVSVFHLDRSSGHLELLQHVTTLPDGFEGTNSTASVRVHPSGNMVYVANRGHDSIAMFSVQPETGLLSPLGRVPSEPVPRPIAITADGRFFFAGSDESGRLSSYRIDAQGLLQPLQVYEVGRFVSWVLPVQVP